MKLVDAFIKNHGGHVLDHLCRHLVPLTWLDHSRRPVSKRSKNSERYDLQPRMATGFLVHTCGYMFWVTAGHVLTTLKDIEDDGRRILKARLLAGWTDRNDKACIPIPLDSLPRLWFDHDHFGFDLGAIVIPRHWARLVMTTSSRPIPRRLWATSRENFDRHVVLGLPTQERQLSHGGGHAGGVATFSAGTPLMRLRQIRRPPKCLQAKYPRFFGKILSMTGTHHGRVIRLEDIDGMSGGPIFGLNVVGDQLEYKLVAVQGSWSKLDRVVAASPSRQLMGFIAKRFVDRLRQTYPGHD